MSRKKYTRTSLLKGMIFFTLFVAYTGCESVLFIELEESDMLIVVNGAITNDSVVAIQVSRTRHILDNAPVLPLEQARVRLLEGGSLAAELSYAGNGYYRAQDFIPGIGKSYTIEVENAGYPAVTAFTQIPEMVPIEKLDTATLEVEQQGGYDYYYGYSQKYLQFDLTLKDPPGENNYYLLYAEADRSWTEYRDTTVKVVDSLYYGGQWNYFLVDSSYTIYDIHRFTDFPSISSSDIVVEAMTSHGVLFSDQLMDGKSYSFRGQFYYDQINAADSAIVDIRLLSVSESYYKYLKSRQSHYETKENYLAVPVIVYSNVEEGTGFFGGYSMDEYTITTFIPEYYRDYYYYDY
ncbi:MAG: DUF4249 domain-containing protein [Bacteroidota bacterium]